MAPRLAAVVGPAAVLSAERTNHELLRALCALGVSKRLNAEDAENAEKTDHELLRALCALGVSKSPRLAAVVGLAEMVRAIYSSRKEERTVIDLIYLKQDQLTELCRRYRVKKLEVFGSASTGRWEEGRSDLDFLVEFLPLEPDQPFNCYFGLLESLETLFGRPVDLVVARAITNPYFQESVEATRQVIYAA